jgi:hypothetical protein
MPTKVRRCTQLVHAAYILTDLCIAAPDPGYDEACSKIWTVYTAEAEKHDKALMESWTRDMKGVLLFVSCLRPIRRRRDLIMDRRLFSRPS